MTTNDALNRISLLEEITSNQDTIEAINEAYEGVGMNGPFNSAEEMFANIDKEDDE